MRPSPQRHTLAVLRTFLGLTQKEMAEIAERSRPTIQAIELGKLKLSFDLAHQIHMKTAISHHWLLNDDVTKPLLGDDGMPYTKAAFDTRRALLLAPARTDADACLELWDVWSMFARHIRIVFVLYTEAYKQGKVPMAAYKSMMATIKVMKDTFDIDSTLIEKVMADADGDTGPEELDELTNIVREFAAATYLELKHKIKRLNKPLSPVARDFIRKYDKRLVRAKKK